MDANAANLSDHMCVVQLRKPLQRGGRMQAGLGSFGCRISGRHLEALLPPHCCRRVLLIRLICYTRTNKHCLDGFSVESNVPGTAGHRTAGIGLVALSLLKWRRRRRSLALTSVSLRTTLLAIAPGCVARAVCPPLQCCPNVAFKFATQRQTRGQAIRQRSSRVVPSGIAVRAEHIRPNLRCPSGHISAQSTVNGDSRLASH